jgi:dolichyl-phosphate-mannose--protein O-mannosyl transferase
MGCPALEIVTVVAWLLTTVVYGYAPSWIVALAIGTLLYLHHAMAALAAHVPVRAHLPVSLLTAWLGRVGGVLALSVAVCPPLVALAGAPLVIPSAGAVVLGAGGALGIAYVLTRPDARGR